MIRFARITLLLLYIGNGSIAQVTQPSGSPEEGFLSRSKYTNAFFGFSFPIPKNTSFQPLSLPPGNPSRHSLFGLQSQEHGLAILAVSATQYGRASSEDAKKAASGPKGLRTKRIEINQKEFWKSESQEKSRAGKMRNVSYATAFASYVLEFTIISFDSKVTDELENGVEAITFFDPAKAKEMAGADSQPYNPTATASDRSGAVPQPSGRLQDLSLGTISGNNYTNDVLGLSYQFPAGWYVADKATQEKVIAVGHEAAWGDSPSAAREHEVARKCMKVLLWANKYPQGTHRENINPLIVVFAADPACFPGAKFPTSSADQEAIRQVAQALVRSFQGTPLVAQEGMKLATLTGQGHLFLEVSGVFHINVPDRPAPVELHNSMMFTSANDFWVIWVFSSGSEAGLQELKNTNIKFSNSSSSRAP